MSTLALATKNILTRFSDKLGALIGALCLFWLMGCATACRQWDFCETSTRHSCYNSGRMLLRPESACNYLELEIVRGRNGIRMYVNLLFMMARPCPEDPCLTTATLTLDGADPFSFKLFIMQGGQRLLIPKDVADMIIERLVEGESVMLRIGRHEMTVVPDKFDCFYEKLMALSVDEEV